MEDYSKQLNRMVDVKISSVINADEFKKYLNFATKFYNFSAKNILALYFQNSDLTYLAPYGGWTKSYNRKIKSNSTGYLIFTYEEEEKMLEKDVFDEAGEVQYTGANQDMIKKENVVCSCLKERTNFVFDISATEIVGDSVSNEVLLETPTIDLKTAEMIFKSLIDAEIIYVVPEEPESKEMQAFETYLYKEGSNTLYIREKISDEEKIIAILCAYSCYVLRNSKTSEQNGLLSQPAQYIILNYFNLNVKRFAFPWINSWKKDKNDTILKRLNQIQYVASTVIMAFTRKIFTVEEADIVNHVCGYSYKIKRNKRININDISNNLAMYEENTEDNTIIQLIGSIRNKIDGLSPQKTQKIIRDVFNYKVFSEPSYEIEDLREMYKLDF